MGQCIVGCRYMSKRMGINRCGEMEDGWLEVITLLGILEYWARWANSFQSYHFIYLYRKVIPAPRMFAFGPTMMMVVSLPMKMPLSGAVTVLSTQPMTNAVGIWILFDKKNLINFKCLAAHQSHWIPHMLPGQVDWVDFLVGIIMCTQPHQNYMGEPYIKAAWTATIACTPQVMICHGMSTSVPMLELIASK